MKQEFSTNAIRQKWIRFFESKQHFHIPSHSLVPDNDPSLLWINSGIATLKDYFAGKKKPISNRLVSCQKCIRTNDITKVGYTSRHHTLFEMLGNFSIGDYFRKEAIAFAAEFIFDILHLDHNRIYITIFQDDDASFQLWQKYGIKADHILRCGKKRNFWEIGPGPCGPCTEIYYDRGEAFDFNNKGLDLFLEDIENDRYVEIWNIVFSEFNFDGKNYTKLQSQNIDTGAGLERIACILQNANTNFETDNFNQLRQSLLNQARYDYDHQLYFAKKKDPFQLFINHAFNVVLDHFKAAVFAISDGVIPANNKRGYVLKKLLRRAFLYADFLGIEGTIFADFINKVILLNAGFYSDMAHQNAKINNLFIQEYQAYRININNSLQHLNVLLTTKRLNASSLFQLVDTYGLPIEIVHELELLTTPYLKASLLNALSSAYQYQADDLKAWHFDIKAFHNLLLQHKTKSKNQQKKVGFEPNPQQIPTITIPSVFDYHNNNFTAQVVALFNLDFKPKKHIKGACYFVLDRTCLYATSGGQVHDLGYVDNYYVSNVFKSPNWINIHYCQEADLSLNQKVLVRYDVIRRKKLMKHHSGEHLLHAALKSEIDTTIKQEGALKTPAKFSIDFSYPQRLSFAQLQKIEKRIAAVIKQNNPTKEIYCDLATAKAMHAIAYFEDVYSRIGPKLRVIVLSDDSIEICGGTHVYHTKEIEAFQIIAYEQKGSGKWRIEAIAGKENVVFFQTNEFQKVQKSWIDFVQKISQFPAAKTDQEIKVILQKDMTKLHYLELKKDLTFLQTAFLVYEAKAKKQAFANQVTILKNELAKQVQNLEKTVLFLQNYDQKILTNAIFELSKTYPKHLFFVFNNTNFIFYTSPGYASHKQINFQTLAKQLHALFGGKSGGKNHFFQGSLKSYKQTEISQMIYAMFL